MNVAELRTRLSERARDAEAVQASAPVANVLRWVLDEMVGLNGDRPQQPDRMLTAAELAERLSVSLRHVYDHADQWPFTRKEGNFTAANGKTYDLSRIDQRQALMDEGYHHYHERIAAAVKAIDAEMLVAEGVFVPRAVGKDPEQHAGVWPGKTRDERYPPMLTTMPSGCSRS